VAVILSGSLFALRGALMLARSPYTNHWTMRYLSYIIDTTLLTAGFMLMTILHQYPFVQGWLTAKVLLLVLYIFLGLQALKYGRTRQRQIASYALALLVFLFIVSVARAHHPMGIVHALFGQSF
jgi:uncharacterized membrane protein SirB2